MIMLFRFVAEKKVADFGSCWNHTEFCCGSIFFGALQQNQNDFILLQCCSNIFLFGWQQKSFWNQTWGNMHAFLRNILHCKCKKNIATGHSCKKFRGYVQHFSGICYTERARKKLRVTTHGFKKIFTGWNIKKCCWNIAAKSNLFDFGVAAAIKVCFHHKTQYDFNVAHSLWHVSETKRSMKICT